MLREARRGGAQAPRKGEDSAGTKKLPPKSWRQPSFYASELAEQFLDAGLEVAPGLRRTELVQAAVVGVGIAEQLGEQFEFALAAQAGVVAEQVDVALLEFPVG